MEYGNLVLTRCPGESVVIDGTITVTLIKLGPGKVRLGIRAPKNVSVHRAEVQVAIKRQQEEQQQCQQAGPHK